MSKKRGQEPAFPVECSWDENGLKGKQTSNYSGFEMGMSKRFYAACKAMEGILSNPNLKHLRCDEYGDSTYPITLRYTFNKKKLINNSFEIADELLKQENET